MWDEPNAELMRQTTRASDPIKSVSSSRQRDCGHGSRNQLRSRVTTHSPNELVSKMDGATTCGTYSATVLRLNRVWGWGERVKPRAPPPST